jgi:hypothetical protein
MNSPEWMIALELGTHWPFPEMKYYTCRRTKLEFRVQVTEPGTSPSPHRAAELAPWAHQAVGPARPGASAPRTARDQLDSSSTFLDTYITLLLYVIVIVC